MSPETLTLIEKIDAELEQRRSSIFTHFGQWKKNPLGFIEAALFGFLWSKQREIVLSVLNNRRTAVASCHDVGKSFIASRVVAWWLSCWEPGEHFAVTLAPTFHQVRAILWREVNKAHDLGGLPGEMNQTEWWHGSELVGFGRSPADTDPTAIQGIHAPAVLLVGDEACGLSKSILDAADSLIANDDSRALLIGNPDDPTSEFERICRPGSGWNVIHIDAFESPNFTTEVVPDKLRPLLVSKIWVEEKRKSWGEGSMLWTSKVRGRFPEQASDSLITMSAMRRAHDRWNALYGPSDAAPEGTPPVGKPNDLGVDVARQGDDKSVFYRRKGLAFRKEHEHRKRDLMELVGEVIRCCRKDKPDRIKIDDAGMGGGVTDRLREIQAYQGKDPEECIARDALAGVQIIPINVGEGAAKGTLAEERFRNLRAELNWNVRMLFENEGGRIAVEANDDLDAQATQIKYKIPSGIIQIERKDEMKKRTKGVSPDDWDALVLAAAEPQFAGAGLMEFYARQVAALGIGGVPPPFGKAAPSGPENRVRMKAPPNVSTIYGAQGNVYQVRDGEVAVSPDDVNPLIGQGFTKV